MRTAPKHRGRSWPVLAALAALVAACTQQAAGPADAVPAGAAADVRVTEVAMGTAVGLDKKISEPAEVFDPELGLPFPRLARLAGAQRGTDALDNEHDLIGRLALWR